MGGGYPVGPRPEDPDGSIRRRLNGPNLVEPWDFALGIEVERMLRETDCGKLAGVRDAVLPRAEPRRTGARRAASLGQPRLDGVVGMSWVVQAMIVIVGLWVMFFIAVLVWFSWEGRKVDKAREAREVELSDPTGDHLLAMMDPVDNPVLEEQRRRYVERWLEDHPVD